MRRPVEHGRSVVVKIGSSSLTTRGGLIDSDAINSVVSQIADLRRAGHPAVLQAFPPSASLTALTTSRDFRLPQPSVKASSLSSTLGYSPTTTSWSARCC